ncbi:trigger factor [Savagea faecisuis]|uniref:Trigger factor n=1 Tax=Savagea faecisuis TaxID=1274803 RepID=A0ABW3GWE1_9BACL
MSVKWEKHEGNEGTLTFTLPAEDFKKALDAAFKKVVKTVQAPGFRKGKMPRKMFEKMYGEEALYNDALDIALPEAYTKALDESGIEPVAQPQIDIEQLEKGKDVIFTAKVVVKPEVELGEYKGLEVEQLSKEVTDAEVDEFLQSRQQAFAEMVVKEEGTIEDGDTVTLDFEGFVDGEAFEGGKAEQYDLEIGSGSFIPGFEEQMVGMANGEEKDVEVSFPEEYHAAELAGKPATFKVKVHAIKTKEIPALDDELANEIDASVKTVAELKEKTKADLAEQKAVHSDNTVRDVLVQQAADNAKIDVPEEMVEAEVDRMVQEFEQNLQSQGMNLDLYFQFSGQTKEQLREQMAEEAMNRVRVSLTLEAIANAESIAATEADVQAELEKMSEQFNIDTEQIKAVLGGTATIENDIKLRNTIEFLVDNAKITEAQE